MLQKIAVKLIMAFTDTLSELDFWRISDLTAIWLYDMVIMIKQVIPIILMTMHWTNFPRPHVQFF